MVDSTNREDVLIVAPTGRDAELISEMLRDDSITTRALPSIADLCGTLRLEGAAAVVIAEEALTRSEIGRLNATLAEQPPWSDIPIILLTSSGETTLTVISFVHAFAPSGYLTLLERPLRRLTLLRTVQVACRARQKQHVVKDLIEKQKAATRLREEFLAIASHELRTPLATLRLQNQLHQRVLSQRGFSWLTNECYENFLGNTGRSIERLVHLVDEMVDFARMRTGKIAVQKQYINLTDLVGEIIAQRQAESALESSVLVFKSSEPIHVNCDRFRIEQVVNNLVSNALRYGGGQPIYAGVLRKGDQARFFVRDMGPGIAANDQKRIFESFEQVPNHMKSQGLGLGLYICRNIVDAHGGRILVESKPGKGSTFIVDLPQAVPMHIPAAPGKTFTSKTLRPSGSTAI